MNEALSAHRTIGIDSAIFIYYIEDDPNYADMAGEVFRSLSQGTHLGCTSVITLMEVCVKPIQLERYDAVDDYLVYINQIPNLSIPLLDQDVAMRAAEMRGRHRLRPADALQVAACLEHGATTFVTNDMRLRRINELDVIILDDFLEENPR